MFKLIPSLPHTRKKKNKETDKQKEIKLLEFSYPNPISVT